ESQERMLMVLDPDKETEAKAVFEKWSLDFATVGQTTNDLRFRVFHQGAEVANLPIKELGDEAPEYDRPWMEPALWGPLPADQVEDVEDHTKALLQLLASPNLSSRRWVWEQYDTLIQGNTLARPGGDAGVIRVDGTDKGLAFSSDVNPRYVEADPFEGGKQAVAECFRNLSAVGAEPIASTDNLNFGNPGKPEIMGTFVKSIEGIGAACDALSMPIVSGNVSLYNETNGEAILPTPTIAAVGLLPEISCAVTSAWSDAGTALFLVGGDGTHLGQSSYMRTLLSREDGPPPPVDLTTEKRNGDYVRASIRSGTALAAHDLSDGGLAVALAEMCIASNMGADCELPRAEDQPHAALFGEDQGRYIVAVPEKWADYFAVTASDAYVQVQRLGTTGGDILKIGDRVATSVADLRKAHESWFPEAMN
ncbi:MAG: AIR synthase-related protein, partial [Pseudomonadota bacterium]